MARDKHIFDVFIAHMADNVRLAEDIASRLRSAGVSAFLDIESISAVKSISDTIWEALAESRALVAVFSDENFSGLGFQIGAAAAWNKPVFIVLDAAATTRLPPMLQSFPVFPIGRIDDLVQRIRLLQEPLTK